MAAQSGWGRFLRRILLWTALTAVLAVGLVGFVLYRELTTSLPPVEQLLNYQPPVATRVFADDGTLIGEFYVERRYLVPLERVPEHVRAAFLAAEDADFYRHRGVNPLSIARAFVSNLQHKHMVQGGSTITQQVVKNLLLTPERSYERKVKELILALKLETTLTKDESLYLYLNQIYFGGGAYGIQAAARVFFDADVSELTLAQAALLAGLPQAPSRYDPLRRPRAALSRQHYVLERMLEERFISTEQYSDAVAAPVTFATRRPATYLAAPWYVEHVRRLLDERYGGAASQLGLRIHTAVNLQMQQQAEEALQRGLREVDRRQGFRGVMRHIDDRKIDAFLQREAESPRTDPVRRGVVTETRQGGLVVRTPWERGVLPADALTWGSTRLAPSRFRRGDVIAVTLSGKGPDGLARFALDQEPQVQGALVAFDPYTGQVKAMVGGYSFGRNQFNRAVQARRQPGSSFKPLVYAAAMDKGFTPASLVLDAPIALDSGAGVWTPKNYDNHYHGPTPLRVALARSLNTVTVRLVQSIGLDYTRDYLRRFGLGTLPRNMSIALGSAEVTPLELVAAYGVFATAGKRFEPIFITGVTDAAGNALDFGQTRPRFERVMNPATAYVMTSMLTSVVTNGTGRKVAALGRPVAGKTGTTNDMHDAWFIGYTPDLLAGVWVGFDSARSLGSSETGGHAAAPIFRDFMQHALEGQPPIDFPVPDGVNFVRVDPGSGLLPAQGGASRLEVFVRGTEPIRHAHPEELDESEGTDIEPAAATDAGLIDND